MEDYVVKIIIVGVISWATLFLLVRRLLPKRSFEFCSRIVSTIHACSAVILASLSVEDWRCPVCPLASSSSPMQMKTIAVSVSYLIYDIICSQFDDRSGVDNSIHHLVSILGLGAGLAYQKCGSEMVASLWLTELSSPFLHLRELLKELGYKGTDLNLAADIMFAIIFSVARMGLAPFLTYVTVSAPTNPLLVKAMALALQLVSAYWFFKIARMVKYKLTKRTVTKKLV
ncbi:hypothetical protein Nepgr_025236 [Nepenthes gracilis]|uniref:TLC domain-containing protein n=1 Tax=Nepenthes gracilis TaxID=150966 RepID=A0AAD3T5R2_NEPGR|nr:hypothetical protein Nepgr_025236 [Nepenthes gracilis]